MLVPKNDPPGYTEYVISFIVFSFRECVTIIDFLSNMKLYVSKILESYKYSIVGHSGNLGKKILLLHIVHSWLNVKLMKRIRFYLWLCAVHSLCINSIQVLGTFIKHNEQGKDITYVVLNNIPYFINHFLRVNYLKDAFVIYNDKVRILKQDIIHTIPGSIIPIYFC